MKRVKQSSSVAKYISEYRNIILAVPELSDGEKFDRFIDGLKSCIRFEVMKTTVNNFEDATKIALHVDSALWGERMVYKGGFFNNSRGQQGTSSGSLDPSPMEIGNIQGRYRGPLTVEQRRQKNIDRQNNACYKCHRKNCRPWKCGQVVSNNTELQATEIEEQKNSDEPELSDSKTSSSEN